MKDKLGSILCNEALLQGDMKVSNREKMAGSANAGLGSVEGMSNSFEVKVS